MVSNQNNELPEGFKMTELGPLPEEWRVTRLGDTVRTVKGKKPDNLLETLEKDCVPYLTAEYFRTLCPSKFVKPQTDVSCVTVSENDVVFIWDGSNAGDVFTGLNGVLASTMVKILPQESNLDSKYLFFFMKTKFDQFNSATTGSTIPHVSKQLFQNMTIPLPPLPEQRAIAHVLSTIQRAIEAQDKLIATARQLKKSLMRHLFTYGPAPLSQADQVPLKETEIGPLPEHWQVVGLGEVTEKPEYGYTASAVSDKVGPKYLRITDIQNGGVDWVSVPYCRCSPREDVKYRLLSGDILFARIGATTGKTFLVEDCPPAIFASYLIRVRTKSSLFQNYLGQFITTQGYWNQIDATKGGRLKQGINIPVLRNLLVSLPPLPEQQEIARILSAVDKKIEAEEKRKAAFQTLFKTMLHLLMTGQLRVKDLKV